MSSLGFLSRLAFNDTIRSSLPENTREDPAYHSVAGY